MRGVASQIRDARRQSSRVTDIAPLAVFLASDESAWITGEVIRAAGGLVVAT
jgi:NAD(P)-dependent dehydrogenase (short-subunit alcohol dehydrogenase family)